MYLFLAQIWPVEKLGGGGGGAAVPPPLMRMQYIKKKREQNRPGENERVTDSYPQNYGKERVKFSHFQALYTPVSNYKC